MLRRKVGKRIGVRDTEEFLRQPTELLRDDNQIEKTTNNSYAGRNIYSFSKIRKNTKRNILR